ncbi:MAG TPA: hypothetical protein VFC90_09870, partial [Planctomycetota bacterium]|nr:hypothetical protein [Planctomycetota bacterium]
MRHSPRALLFVFSILALPAGCGDDGGSAGLPGPMAPSGNEIFHVQSAASAVGALGQVTEVASDAIVFSAPGSSTPGPAVLPTHPGATPSFDYGADVDFVIDFDALDVEGNDLFPNATGQVHVTASGTDSDTPDAGEATFSAAVTADTDLIFTDPGTGMLTGIPAGDSWSYLLTVTWSRADNRNWTVSAASRTLLNFTDIAVFDGTTIVTVDIVGEREVVSTRTREDGKLTHERTISGSLVVTTDDGTTVETVILDYVNPGQVKITVAGNAFGPMSGPKAQALFQAFLP